MSRTNDLGRDEIPRLVVRLAIPTMLAQLVNVLYSIVDRMYIGTGVGDLALAGVGICSPIVTLLASFGSMVGQGGAPVMAMKMGSGKKKEARQVLNNGFLMLLILSAVLTSLFLLSKNSLLMWFGAILNILLDPLFIFVFHMGVAGAAIATVISQIVSCLFVLGCLFSKRMPVRLGWGDFHLHVMKRIVTFGFSPFLILASDSILLIVLNTVLQRYGGPGEGDTLVTCATIVQSYLLLITMPMGGITLGSQPVVSFNYGKGDAQRIKKAILYITGLCVSFCILMTVVTWTISPVYVRLFTDDSEILSRSVTYIKRFTFMIIPLAVQYPLVDETTALGKVKLALFCSAFRKCVFLTGLILLPALLTADATFFSEPIADVVSATMTSCLFFHFFPKILKERERITI